MKLSLRSLDKNYTGPDGKTIRALSGCSLEVTGGSFTAIAGKSGCGKTTLLKVIAGLLQSDSGSVEFTGMREGEIRPKTGIMFQDHRLLPWLTVEQNLALAFPLPKNNSEKIKIHGEIMRVLAMTGIADRSSSLPHELSGGMAQRAALARCLCRNPDLLLLDEPLGSLDTFTRFRLREELEKLWLELGITVILVTHDIEEAVFFGERVFLMNNGMVECEVPVSLPRPRNRSLPEFQDYCRKIMQQVTEDKR